MRKRLTLGHYIQEARDKSKPFSKIFSQPLGTMYNERQERGKAGHLGLFPTESRVHIPEPRRGCRAGDGVREDKKERSCPQ